MQILQHTLAVILERVVQTRIITPRRTNDKMVQVSINSSSSKAKCEPLAELGDCVLAKERKAVQLGVPLHQLDDGYC